jgi:hypothetical protein
METGHPPKSIIRALRQLLYPLVRLMLAKGITYPYLSDLMKEVFVEVADRDFRIPGKPQTDSRISLLSGVHRKDVKRLRSSPRDGERVSNAAVSLGSQLVAAWMGDARFLDTDGRPLALPRLASTGAALSFEGLVASVSKDIRSRAVLDEWLRLGVVHLDDFDRVVLNASAFVPQKGMDEKAFYFGHNLHDHAAAAAHNVLGEGPPYLERCVHYDALDAAAITELAALAESTGMQAALTVNRRAMELEKREAAANEPRQRMTFGIYFYSAPAQGQGHDEKT